MVSMLQPRTKPSAVLTSIATIREWEWIEILPSWESFVKRVLSVRHHNMMFSHTIHIDHFLTARNKKRTGVPRFSFCIRQRPANARRLRAAL